MKDVPEKHPTPYGSDTWDSPGTMRLASRWVLETYRGFFVRWMIESEHNSINEAEEAGRRQWRKWRVKMHPDYKKEFDKVVPPVIRI